MVTGTMRDRSDWQIKYVIECEICGYAFEVDKESLDTFTVPGRERLNSNPWQFLSTCPFLA